MSNFVKTDRIFTRREFIRVAGSAVALASLPLGLRTVQASSTQPQIGGPTPNDKFYVTSYGSTPTVDANTWRLKISGLVKQPLVLTYDELRKLPPVDETLTLECISNPPDGSAISNAQWVGTKLSPILERAGISGKAQYAVMRAADGYFTGAPVEEIMRRENFLPYLMNGAPLPAEHGFPVRIFIPGKYGMKQPKWITEIEFVDHDVYGYWETRGWSHSAWRKVNSGFFAPRPASIFLFSSATKIKGPTDLYGWALAGPSGIKRVEVSFDDGQTWREAQLIENSSPYVWTVWKYHWTPSGPGSFRMRVRATSGDGITQPRTDPQSGSGMSGQPAQDFEVS